MDKDKIIKEFDSKQGTFITESGTKIRGLSVVPLSQIVNVLPKLLALQKKEILQIVSEDVPHQYQGRLLKILI